MRGKKKTMVERRKEKNKKGQTISRRASTRHGRINKTYDGTCLFSSCAYKLNIFDKAL